MKTKQARTHDQARVIRSQYYLVLWPRSTSININIRAAAPTERIGKDSRSTYPKDNALLLQPSVPFFSSSLSAACLPVLLLFYVSVLSFTTFVVSAYNY